MQPVVYTDTIEVICYEYGRASPLKTTHELEVNNLESLSIENLQFNPIIGSGKVNMRIAANSELKAPDVSIQTSNAKSDIAFT